MFNNNNSQQWNNNSNSQQWNNNNNDNNNNNLMFSSPSNQVHGLKNYYDRSLLPTTIKQILLAPDPEPDEPFKIDGKHIHQIQIIAKITSITHKTTHTLFMVDDQGVTIQCKLWSSDNDDIKQLDEEKLQNGNLVKIIGKVDVFKSTKSINIHDINKIKNFDMVYQHGIEVIFAHEMNNVLINQHIPKYNNMWNTYIQNAHNEQQETREKYEKARQQNMNKNNNNNEENSLNDLERKVLNFLRIAKKNGSDVNGAYLGQSINDIGQGIGMQNTYQIQHAMNALYKKGLVHDTTDNNHWDAY